jgi:FkbM family methyltransferase
MRLLRRFLKKILDVHFPRVSIACRRFQNERVSIREPVDTPMGFKLVGLPVMERGSFEQEEALLVRRLLKEADVVINVGANVGFYCCLSLHEKKQVVAFEPIAPNLRCLYKNITANHWQDKIEIFPIAVSNKTGLLEIFGGGTGASLIKGWSGTPENYVEWVPVSTLDIVLGSRFVGKRCLFIVDIEGAELGMLEGASQMLAADPKPIWLVEVSIAEHQPKGVSLNPNLISTFEKFWAHGYEAWTATKVPRLVLRDEVENIVKTGKDTLLTHDFIFVEKGGLKVYLEG